MKLAYFSVTGQTRRFVSKTNLPNVEISPDDDIEMNEPFLFDNAKLCRRISNCF